DAPVLEVLGRGAPLCYSASAIVGGKDDSDLAAQAEDRLAGALRELGLKATRAEDADVCDRELSFSFSVDIDGPPTIYLDSLTLYSYIARESGVTIPQARLWRDGEYGGDVRVLGRAAFTREMHSALGDLLGGFALDYRSVRKEGSGLATGVGAGHSPATNGRRARPHGL
ncbi:MAG: hypothetical protein ACR2J4_08555, partial [Deinococcus sp.]